MKKICLSLFMLAFGLMACAQTEDAASYTKVGQTVPEFSFELEKGKTVNISDFKGKLILINLFATWCPPCNVELPEAQTKIWDKYKNNPNFAFFVFGREEGWEKLIPYKAQKGFTFPILPDLNRKIFSKFAKESIPRNIIVDQSGKIIYQSLGYQESEFKAMLELIDKRLKALSK